MKNNFVFMLYEHETNSHQKLLLWKIIRNSDLRVTYCFSIHGEKN